jgi:biotin transport system permease protein
VRAVESVGDLVTLALLVTVLTVTTPVDEMLDTITQALRPLRRSGWTARAWRWRSH